MAWFYNTAPMLPEFSRFSRKILARGKCYVSRTFGLEICFPGEKHADFLFRFPGKKGRFPPSLTHVVNATANNKRAAGAVSNVPEVCAYTCEYQLVQSSDLLM